MPYGNENVAIHFPNKLAEDLAAPTAEHAAANMAASQWASCLRNALAHGGVAYLNEQGYQSVGDRAAYLAFVSARYPRGNLRQPPECLQVLRIAEDDFLVFLRKWAVWISDIGLSRALAA